MKKVLRKISFCIMLVFMTAFYSQALPLNAVAANASDPSVDTDGTIHGAQIGTDIDGKAIYTQPPFTDEMQKLYVKKEQMVAAHERYKNQQISKTEYLQKLKSLGVDSKTLTIAETIQPFSKEQSFTAGDEVSSYSAKSSSNNIASLIQQPQQTTYWCGPATASEIVIAYFKGGSYSQSTMAANLGTTTSGTPWSTNTWPMANTLNHFENQNWYIPYGTDVEAETFKSDVTSDIDYLRGVAANADEVAGSTHPHLTGHPTSLAILHWVAIDGYLDYGNQIHYADSVHNSSVSWASSVPAYSSLSYTTMARIMNGRGIIW